MAVVTSRTCDIDVKHGEAQAYTFGVGPEFSSADLCEPCKGKLDAALEPFYKVAIPIPVRDLVKSGNGASYDPQAVRSWAQRKGKPVGDRGRIPAELVAEYKATGN